MGNREVERKRESGQGLVELAITLPMLILILAGLAHFGLLLQANHVITNASRLGARRSTQAGGEVANIQAAVSSYCQQAGLDATKVTTQVNINSTTGQSTVTVSYAFTSPVEGILTAAGGMFKHTIVVPSQLQATTVMRL
jgi:Flp pilus assembly protein TadG